MKFKEIINRLTGFSTPVFGIQWNPPETERKIAIRVITFLEDRRVLYRDPAAEIPEYCVESVLEIREYLTSELMRIDAGTEIELSLRAMRSECRKFLNKLDSDPLKSGVEQRTPQIHSQITNDAPPWHWSRWLFFKTLGELRGVFGIHIAQLAVK